MLLHPDCKIYTPACCPSKSLPAAAIGVEKEVPELLAPEHVDEEVGGRVDAAQEIGEGDDDVEERRALAPCAFLRSMQQVRMFCSTQQSALTSSRGTI